MSSRTKAYLALLTTAILWGAALPIIKPVFQFINPFQFLYLRYLLASVLIIPVVIFYLYRKTFKLKDVLKIICLELIQIFSLILLYLGLEKTSAIEASLLGATDPIFLAIGGIIFLKERQNNREWKGLIISFIGTIFLIFEPFLSNLQNQLKISFIGNLLLIGYLLTITIYYLTAKVQYRRYPKIAVTAISYPIAMLVLLGINRLSGHSVSLTLFNQPTVLITCAYMAVFGSIVAFTLYLYGQNLIEASEAGMFTYLHIPFALLTAYIMLKEVITWPQILALVVIAYGVYLAEFRPKRYNLKS